VRTQLLEVQAAGLVISVFGRSISIERNSELPEAGLRALSFESWETALVAAQCLLVDRRLARTRSSSSHQPSGRMWPSEIEAAQQAWAKLVHEFYAAFEAYRVMADGDDYGEAPMWLERLAVCWREAGEQRKIEAIESDFVLREQAELLAVLESALVLATSSDPETEAIRPSPAELGARLVLLMKDAARATRQASLKHGTAEIERHLGVRFRHPRRWSGRPWVRPFHRAQRSRALALVPLVAGASIDAIDVYKELISDADGVSDQLADRASRTIEAVTVEDRTLDLERYVFSTRDWDRVWPWLIEKRSLRRSFFLILSSDPAVREMAMPVGELQSRLFVANERNLGMTRPKAMESLRAMREAQSAKKEREPPSPASPTDASARPVFGVRPEPNGLWIPFKGVNRFIAWPQIAAFRLKASRIKATVVIDLVDGRSIVLPDSRIDDMWIPSVRRRAIATLTDACANLERMRQASEARTQAETNP
jgi:hypothetical protein